MGKVFKITKKTKVTELNSWLASLPPSKIKYSGAKKFNARLFFGKLKNGWDGQTIQKEMRNEW